MTKQIMEDAKKILGDIVIKLYDLNSLLYELDKRIKDGSTNIEREKEMVEGGYDDLMSNTRMEVTVLQEDIRRTYNKLKEV